ncbi:MAG: hypothetical protein ABIS18_10955, partial [Actinomycetota bacterium]
AVLGACVFANGASTSPITALISPAGGATVALSNAGGVVHTFPNSGTTYNAAPGAYTWATTALAGYAISGASTGGFTALSCAPPILVLGNVITPPPVVVTTAAAQTRVLGTQVTRALPATGPGMPVPQTLSLGLFSIMMGLMLSAAGKRRVRPIYSAKHLQRDWCWDLEGAKQFIQQIGADDATQVAVGSWARPARK